MTKKNMQMSMNVSKQRGRGDQISTSKLTVKANGEIYAFLARLLDRDE
jgi:hypothetical protein